jgi:hypothetical protein
MDFVKTFTLELIANIPVWMGFMIAAKLLYESKNHWWQSILILFASAVVTSAIIIWAEPLKLNQSTPGTLYLDQVLEMAAVFTLVGLPFLWYVQATASRSWKTDLALAGLIGLMLTLGEGLVMQVSDVRILLLHSLSMAVAAGVTLPTIRLLTHKTWLIAISGVLVVTVLVSGLIVAVEYVPRPSVVGSTHSAQPPSR